MPPRLPRRVKVSGVVRVRIDTYVASKTKDGSDAKATAAAADDELHLPGTKYGGSLYVNMSLDETLAWMQGEIAKFVGDNKGKGKSSTVAPATPKPSSDGASVSASTATGAGAGAGAGGGAGAGAGADASATAAGKDKALSPAAVSMLIGPAEEWTILCGGKAHVHPPETKLRAAWLGHSDSDTVVVQAVPKLLAQAWDAPTLRLKLQSSSDAIGDILAPSSDSDATPEEDDAEEDELHVLRSRIRDPRRYGCARYRPMRYAHISRRLAPRWTGEESDYDSEENDSE